MNYTVWTSSRSHLIRVPGPYCSSIGPFMTRIRFGGKGYLTACEEDLFISAPTWRLEASGRKTTIMRDGQKTCH